MTWLQTVKDCFCASPNLKERVETLEAFIDSLQEIVIRPEGIRGGSTNGLSTGVWQDGATVNRTAAGRWQVRFTNPHPDGIQYTPEFSWQEPSNTRDNPKIGIVQGTKNANGFDVMITVDDNGGTADIYSDQPWSFGVEVPVTVYAPQ